MLTIIVVGMLPFAKIELVRTCTFRGGDIGGQGGLVIQGGRAPQNYLTTALSKVPKLPYYWLGICTVRIESISKLSSSSRRGALPLFSSPRDESSGKRTPHEY